MNKAPRNFIQQLDGTFKPMRRRMLMVLRDADSHKVIKEIPNTEYWMYQSLVNNGEFDLGYPDTIWVYEDL